MGFKPRLELPNPTGPGVQTVQFPVPSGKCGLVIGKGMWWWMLVHCVYGKYNMYVYGKGQAVHDSVIQ